MEWNHMTVALVGVLVLLILHYLLKMEQTHEYWKRKGLPYLKPLPIFGNILKVISMRMSIGDLYYQAYLKFPNERLVGVYEIYNPVLVLRDPQLIEKILVKDFQHFTDHPTVSDDGGIFNNGLFQLTGQKWRSIRHKVSPAFTSGKLKEMFTGMSDCSDALLANIKGNENNDYEIRRDIAKFTLDVVATTVFGIQIKDTEAINKFINMASSIFDPTPFRFVHIITLTLLPKLAALIGLKFVPDETSKYFDGLIKNTLKQREASQFERKDYTQQLLELKQKGVIEIQNKDKAEEDDYLYLDNASVAPDNIVFSDDILSGQAFQFLTGGFDLIVATMVYLLYELSNYQEVQERARAHVKEVLQNHNNQYSYAAVKEMTYLEQCIQETLRIHPLATYLFRECTKKYYLTDANLEIEKGQKVVLSLLGLQMDPKYYPDPKVFNPDRLPPNSAKHGFTYIPFGDGPRICIGIRYAMNAMKLGLAKLLINYKFTLSSKTKFPLQINKLAFIAVPNHKIFFNITKL